jgi:D-beta-D-heptose 7-phosphate kinase/D-beta-D-heptose 1-phosphate adenosyltransferase
MPIPDWRDKRVIVLGDLILDRFVYGEVHRISPEAPIPVVEVRDERAMPGGAANVASNVRALGGGAAMLGVVGDDEPGEHLVSLLKADGVDVSGLLRDPGRCTTVKTRIVAHRQQVVRVDREVRTDVSDRLKGTLLARLQDLLPLSGALVVSDYAKGLFSPPFLESLGALARKTGIPYIVDPKPLHFPYPGATVLTPNRQEAAGLLGRPFTAKEIPDAARELMDQTDWGAVLFTLGPEGMALAERGRPLVRLPARVREVFDVTGAGDTVVAALALGLAAGLPLVGAARLANLAAGVVVGKVGTAVCTPAELEAAQAADSP